MHSCIEQSFHCFIRWVASPPPTLPPFFSFFLLKMDLLFLQLHKLCLATIDSRGWTCSSFVHCGRNFPVLFNMHILSADLCSWPLIISVLCRFDFTVVSTAWEESKKHGCRWSIGIEISWEKQKSHFRLQILEEKNSCMSNTLVSCSMKGHKGITE